VFTGVNPCARSVAVAALSPSALEGCDVNAGAVAVRVPDASVPPLEPVVDVGEVDVVVAAVGVDWGAAGACAAVLGALAVFALDPQAESAAAHAESPNHPSRRIG
jgi:hypothetical protein